MHTSTQKLNAKGYPSAGQPDRLAETTAARGLEVLAVEVVCCQLLQTGAGRAQLAEHDMPSKQLRASRNQSQLASVGEAWALLVYFFSSVPKQKDTK